MATEIMEAMLPQDVGAERSILGSIIIDPFAYYEIADEIGVEDFYRDAHRTLYQTIVDIVQSGSPADYVTICSRLDADGKLEQVGGGDYISLLTNDVPTSGNAKYYARIVANKAVLRRLIHATGQIAAKAYTEDPESILFAQQAILNIQSRQKSQTTAILEPANEYLVELDQRAERFKENPNALIGITSGLHDLDKLIPGLEPKHVTILAARPAMGKSSLAVSVARRTAKAGNGVVFFTFEMSKMDLVEKMVSDESGVDSTRVRKGEIYDDEWENIIHVTHNISTLPIWLDDTPGLTVPELEARVQRIMLQQPVQLVVIDYIQQLASTSKGNRQEVVSEISRNIKIMAMRLGVSVLALAQLSRGLESRSDHRPMMSDLRESGNLEQDADNIIFIYRDVVYNPETPTPNLVELIVAKQRRGPTGVVTAYFNNTTTGFYGVEYGGNA